MASFPRPIFMNRQAQQNYVYQIARRTSPTYIEILGHAVENWAIRNDFDNGISFEPTKGISLSVDDMCKIIKLIKKEERELEKRREQVKENRRKHYAGP